jgi:hypothetical protein
LSRRLRFISMRRFHLHELRHTARIILGADASWLKQTELYSKLQTEAIRSFLKTLGPLVFGYLIASSLRSGNQIGLNISSISVFAPASFFLFLLSLTLPVNAIALNHLSVAMAAKSKLAGKVLIPGFSANAFDVMNSTSENGLGIPFSPFRFHKEVIPIQSLLQILFGLSLASLLLPLTALGYFLVSEQITLALNSEISLVERLAALMGVITTLASAFFVIFFYIPMPTRKNKDYIRWVFLYGLHPPTKDKIISNWLKERSQNN